MKERAATSDRWRSSLLRSIPILCVLALLIAYYRSWSTEPMVLPNGQEFAVLKFDRHTSYVVASDGATAKDEFLWVRYYANGPDASRDTLEARALAPEIYRLADSLQLATIELQPTRPLLARHFPLIVSSWMLRFTRDSSGNWGEVSAK